MRKGLSILMITTKARRKDAHALRLTDAEGNELALVDLVCGTPTINAAATALSDMVAQTIYRKKDFPKTEEARVDAVRPLAACGWTFLETIAGADGRARILDVIKRLPPDEFIEVMQGASWIPWSLVYAVDPAALVSTREFVGARNLIFEPIQGDRMLDQRDGIGEEDVDFEKNAYGYVEDDTLEAVAEERAALMTLVPTFDAMTEDGDDTRPPLDPGNFGPELLRYGGYVARGWVALHFAVHGSMPNEDASLYRMTVSSRFEHSLRQLEDAIDHHGPDLITFAFFNACLSGKDNSAWETGAAATFRDRGADGAIGTASTICDFVAARFSALFYERTVNGNQSVGAAMAGARRALIAESGGNPACLVYSLYGNPDTMLAA